MYKVCVFASGRGSNLRAVWEYINESSLNVKIQYVVSNKRECGALAFAAEKGIETFTVGNPEKPGSVTYKELISILRERGISLIVLAGFLKKIPDEFIDAFPEKIINIHPALLPFFGGKGMYGMNVHNAVFKSGMKVSGVTIHFVDKIYDHGKIIAQSCVDIADAQSPEEIAGKVLREEHKLLPRIIGKFAENKIKIEKDIIYII